MRLAITADLHWGHQARGDVATRALADFVRAHPPDLLILAGDIGTGHLFSDCLRLFDDVPCRKALTPGNHDIWVPTDGATDSLHRYERLLPRMSAEHGFHYLDQSPLLFAEAAVAVVGSMNWYDYSWSIAEIHRLFPDDEHRLASKRFTRGRHNDANFVRWPLDDAGFTARVVGAFERQLENSLRDVSHAIVVTHHPSMRALGFPHDGPPVLDSLLWEAFCGNTAMEEVLLRRAQQTPFAFCGHTHRARSERVAGIRGFNIGGDYHFKRLLELEWPAGEVVEHSFGEEGS